MSNVIPRKYDGIPLKIDGIPIRTDDSSCCCRLLCCQRASNCIEMRVLFPFGYSEDGPCTATDLVTGETIEEFRWLLYSADGLTAWSSQNQYYNGVDYQSFDVSCVTDLGYDWSSLVGDAIVDSFDNIMAGAETLSCEPWHAIWRGPNDLGHPLAPEGCYGVPEAATTMIYLEAYEVACPSGIGEPRAMQQIIQPIYSIGPGTIIKQELAKFGIEAKAEGCKCNELAAMMDRVGPDIVEKDIDKYVNKMRESIKSWKSKLPIPTPPDFVIRQLILHGVKRSRESRIISDRK